MRAIDDAEGIVGIAVMAGVGLVIFIAAQKFGLLPGNKAPGAPTGGGSPSVPDAVKSIYNGYKSVDNAYRGAYSTGESLRAKFDAWWASLWAVPQTDPTPSGVNYLDYSPTDVAGYSLDSYQIPEDPTQLLPLYSTPINPYVPPVVL